MLIFSEASPIVFNRTYPQEVFTGLKPESVRKRGKQEDKGTGRSLKRQKEGWDLAEEQTGMKAKRMH